MITAKQIFLGFSGALLLSTSANAAGLMDLTVDGFRQESMIPAKYALCKATPDGKSAPGENLRPDIHWGNVPEKAQSFVFFVYDPDVPADFTDAGKEGKTIPKSAARQTFFHWAVVNIPATARSIPGGKPDAPLAVGTPLPGDLGKYVPDAKQYGGPCPPWNDMRVHHYHYFLYALDVKTLDPLPATAREAFEAVKPHIIADRQVEGTYSLNPAVIGKSQ